MKVYIVIWSECDSGYEVLGAFHLRQDAERFASKSQPSKTSFEYDTQKVCSTDIPIMLEPSELTIHEQEVN